MILRRPASRVHRGCYAPYPSGNVAPVARPHIVCATLALTALAASSAAAQAGYFEIRVVDEAGAPVPCVELRTVHELSFTTDANGRVAFYEPGLMDTDVWFHVSGPHVERAPDGFGYRGAQLVPSEGGTADVVVTRTGDPPCEPGDLETRRLARGVPPPEGFFRVDVTDAETGRGVPLARAAPSGSSPGCTC